MDEWTKDVNRKVREDEINIEKKQNPFLVFGEIKKFKTIMR